MSGTLDTRVPVEPMSIEQVLKLVHGKCINEETQFSELDHQLYI